MITDYAQFTGLLSLGLNLEGDAPSATTDAEREILDTYIAVYEEEYLRLMLGDDAYREFAEWTEREREEDEAGTDDDSLKWNPLLDLLTKPYSPIACYIFFKYVQTGNYSVCRTGTLTSADDDAVSPEVLQIRVWNEMVRRNRMICRLFGDEMYRNVQTDPSMTGTINTMGI